MSSTSTARYWVYASREAFLYLGVEAERPLELPQGAPEYMAVRFEKGLELEDSVAFVPEVEDTPSSWPSVDSAV